MADAAPRLVAALADRYRIERELGTGGMATVYLAEDVRHHRRVAVKVLHPELSAIIGAERFLKEIELTANLQHPHILPLFDSGHATIPADPADPTAPTVLTILYYVMPYVEGETLRRRLERERQLAIPDAVRIAREVADALAYAHGQRIIHRDIKPENVLLQGEHALVADFGIALAVQEAGGSRMTQTGMSIGTPQYMAPEQAMGDRNADHRVDVYALGAVTYEMLAGEPPFTGPTSQAIVARVMTEDPKPLTLQRRSIPEPLETAVLTALEKLPADRFASAAEFARALAGAEASHETRRPARRAASRLRPGLLVAAGVALAAAGFALGRWLTGVTPPVPTFGTATPVTWDAGLEVHPAISPDGRLVAYAAGAAAEALRVFVRPVAGGRAAPLTDAGTEGQSGPRWSPDGTRLLFLALGGVFSAPAFGGPARQEIPAPEGEIVTSAAWSPDGGRIAFSAGDSLFIREAGAGIRAIAAVPEASLCAWSPSGTRIACASGNAQYDVAAFQIGNLSPSRIAVVDVGSGTVAFVTDADFTNQSPIWLRDDRLLFVSTRHGPRDIYALDIGRDGAPVREPVRLSTGLGAHSISASADGSRLAYSAFSTTANLWSLPITSGPPLSVDAAEPVTWGSQLIETFSVSRDNQWLLYDSNIFGSADIYRMRLPSGEPERLTTDPSDDFAPSLSPDGRDVAFHSWRSGNRDIFVLPLDGGAVQQVTSTPRQEVIANWSPDGSALAFFEFSPLYDTVTSGSSWMSRRQGTGAWSAPERLLERAGWASWSPDGRVIAHGGGLRSARIVVVPPDGGRVRVVYEAGAGEPLVEQIHWSADGGTIFFKSHDSTGAASIWGVPAAGGAPRELVRFDDPARQSYRYSFALDRSRFYFTIEERRSDVGVLEMRPD